MSLPVGSASSWLVPLALAGCGALAALLAVMRARRAQPGSDGRAAAVARLASRGLTIVYTVVAATAVVVAGIECASRVQLFWSVDWDAQRGTLVLDRLAPMSDVNIPQEELDSVTEISARERSLSGPRVVVRFVVRSTSGEEFWSAPIHEAESATAVRRLLERAGNDRLETFSIGGAALR